MNNEEGKLREFEENNVVYRFDVECHHMPVDVFTDTVNATQKILDSFNEELFNDEAEFKLYVSAPKAGSFIETLMITVLAAGVVWQFLESEMGKRLVKGLFKSEPGDITESLGKKIREWFVGENHSDDVYSQMVEEAVVAQMVTRFLEENPDRLRRIGFKKSQFKKAHEAKDNVLQSCLDSPEITGLGFRKSGDFKLRQENFADHMMWPEKNKLIGVGEVNWAVETVEIDVYAPAPLQDTAWTGVTKEFKWIEFWVYDEKYLERIKDRRKMPKVHDKMLVQLACQTGARKSRDFKVLKILLINGKRIGNKLKGKRLAAVLEKGLHNEAEQAVNVVLVNESEEEKVRLQVRWSE